MFQVLVIGAGTMGGVHAEAWRQMEKVKLAGIVDRDLMRAQRLAQDVSDPGLSSDATSDSALTLELPRTFESLAEAMAACPDVQVIDICLPTFLHKETVRQAADLVPYVICEKPLAGNLQDAQEMIDLCAAKKVKLCVGHVVRFFPEYARAREQLAQGRVGDVGMARLSRTGPFPAGWKSWYRNEAQSGGLLLDLVIHDFDFLRWCFGEVERVYAKMIEPSAGPAYALTILRFVGGVIAHVEGSWSHAQFSTRFELAGRKGIIEYDSAREVPLILSRKEDDDPVQRGVAVPESPLAHSPYYRELAHFVDCFEQGIEPVVDAYDALKAVEISLAALESAKTGRPVKLAHSAGPADRKGGEA